MWTPGAVELILIGFIALLIFSKRLPEMAHGLGASFTQFKKGLKEAKYTKKDIEREDKNVISIDAQKDNGAN
ncbi:MAG: twin-arginine translocase TatA/TatE family subunit [Aliifodinibius sp.]|nr:twin-arginine translocase TatA/TatE family subunit [Fodinibius sp.]NIV10603.1 twin-arginine translocase TatA/TatE family subunit [Fodinibius sp.]NIY24231.1 twin-arginine translocase TatA/TatE family subunit [Fodinibius sp.]